MKNKQQIKLKPLSKKQKKELKKRNKTKKLKDIMLGTKTKDGGIVIGNGENRQVMKVNKPKK